MLVFFIGAGRIEKVLYFLLYLKLILTSFEILGI